MLRTGKSASKDVPATGQAGERLAIITSLSPHPLGPHFRRAAWAAARRAIGTRNGEQLT